MLKIRLPSETKKIAGLEAGDTILISGPVYTARDQAHKRLAEAIKEGKALPFGLKGQIIYYCGATPAPEGRIIGSCGPTTSSRMDAFTPALLKAGLIGMIGKGRRSQAVVEAIKKYRAVYLLAYAGCGALISGYVRKMELIAYKELGPEAIYKLEVRDLPLIVGIDALGNDIYKKASTSIKQI
jgi:fumarate hydratase subunit beta